MDKETRNLLANTTQAVRRMLEEEFRLQLEGTFDVHEDGRIPDQSGAPLTDQQRLIRRKIVEAILHRRSIGENEVESVGGFLRETSFTFLNRLAALKLMEARGLVMECVSSCGWRDGKTGTEAVFDARGFKEFSGLAPGLIELPDKGYRLYLECLFDEIGREVGILFDRTDTASLLWPRRKALADVLTRLNDPSLATVWSEDETIGWIYQYWNDPAERKKMRDESAAPRNSREMAVRNQFFTPRYVVEFLTDNALGRLWYEMTKGQTRLKDRCRYLIRRPVEIFLPAPPPRPEDPESHQDSFAAFNESANPVHLPDCPVMGDAFEWINSLTPPGCYGFESLLPVLGLAHQEVVERWLDHRFESGEAQPDFSSAHPLELLHSFWRLSVQAGRDGHWPLDQPVTADRLAGLLWNGLLQSLRHPPRDISRGDLLKQPVFIPHRPLKDPRTILMLDPACGSMHFGLYAFDLFEVIYEEWWDRSATLAPAESCLREPVTDTGRLKAMPALLPLTSLYASKEAFLREVPRLIIEHNIHGIDIDPRAAQIAGFALWLRAQKAWQGMGLRPAERPGIRRSNIVCAEPMPGETELLTAFVAESFPPGEQPFFQKLLDAVFEKMKLAGEAGSLLQIEEEIRFLVHGAREAWKQLGKRSDELFAEVEIARADLRTGAQLQLDLGSWSLDALSGIPDAEFWERAESRIYSALKAFAERADSTAGFQRRLFADDAARGFAFIDLCRQRYDVALMNPPFGDASLPSRAYIEDTYGDTKGDVYKAFVECFHARLVPAGYLGIISSRSGFFLGQSEDWRTRVVLRLFRPIALADLGSGVLDAMVEVAAYVLRSLSAPEARDLTLSLVPVLEKVVRDSQGRFSLPKWQAARDDLKRHQAIAELEHLAAHGFIERSSGETVRYTPLWHSVKTVATQPEAVFPPLVCIRALADEDKGTALAAAVRGSMKEKTFICHPSDFAKIPASTFAYWVGGKVLSLFEVMPKLQGDGRGTAVGASTKDDFRYLRLAWEIEANSIASSAEETADGLAWVSFAKGGTFAPYYADHYLVIQWRQNGREIKESISEYRGSRGWGYQWTAALNGHSHYFRCGLTWPRRTNGLSFRVMPSGCIFDNKGPALFVEGDDKTRLLALNALVSSLPFRGLVALQLARVELAQSFEVGVIQRTPLPQIDRAVEAILSDAARNAWHQKRAIDTDRQTSHAFTHPSLIGIRGTSLTERAAALAARVRTSEETVASIQAEIDNLAFRLYGLDAADRAALTSTLATEATEATEATGEAEAEAEAGEDEEEEEEEEEEAATADAAALAADLLAYALGCAFGRWDIRYATGERSAPPAPDPFAPLPVCPPGMLQNSAGLPATPADVVSDYPLRISWPGILVDDPHHPEDIGQRLREFFELLWPDRADAMEQEACTLLGAKSLREYFRKPAGFFADHLKRYSKSRRQAPIYWPLSSPNGLYTVWLYYHRLNADTLFTVLRDYVKPILEDEERRAFQLKQEAGPAPSPSQRREITDAEDLVEDLRALTDELTRAAPLFRPNLNDGVILNCAPLWRLMALPKWQKDCKAAWEELSKGSYDWSHLAFHLWPDRVILKCVTDRSLAIAHGLEEIFWEEIPLEELKAGKPGKASKRPKAAAAVIETIEPSPEDEPPTETPAGSGKWRPKTVPAVEVQSLIATRTSPAIKAALEALASAPVAGIGKKGRKSAK